MFWKKKCILIVLGLTVALIASVVNSDYTFESIEQPYSVVAGETFTVFIVVTTDEGEGQPCFGICLPLMGIEYIGGLVGSQIANHATVSNSFATGDVFGWLCVGGLVGFNHCTVSKCSSSSFISGASFLGGLVGYNDITGSLLFPGDRHT